MPKNYAETKTKMIFDAILWLSDMQSVPVS